MRPNLIFHLFFHLSILSSLKWPVVSEILDLGRSADFLQHVRHCWKDLRPAFKPSEDEAPHAVQISVTCQNQPCSAPLVLSNISRSNWSSPRYERGFDFGLALLRFFGLDMFGRCLWRFVEITQVSYWTRNQHSGGPID